MGMAGGTDGDSPGGLSDVIDGAGVADVVGVTDGTGTTGAAGVSVVVAAFFAFLPFARFFCGAGEGCWLPTGVGGVDEEEGGPLALLAPCLFRLTGGGVTDGADVPDGPC